MFYYDLIVFYVFLHCNYNKRMSDAEDETT